MIIPYECAHLDRLSVTFIIFASSQYVMLIYVAVANEDLQTWSHVRTIVAGAWQYLISAWTNYYDVSAAMA